jgi:hypothetical protein
VNWFSRLQASRESEVAIMGEALKEARVRFSMAELTASAILFHECKVQSVFVSADLCQE